MPIEQRVGRKEVGQAWQKPGLFGLNALALFIDTFGTEALTWAPETIEMELRDEFGGDAEDANYERLMAAISVVTTDSFFNSVPDFCRVCVTLAGHRVGAESMILPDSGDVAWGITEAMLINRPDDKEPFSPEVVEFIRQVLDEEGILSPPDVLRIAGMSRKLMDQVSYDFSDDPTMFQAIQENEESRSQAVDLLVRGRMKSLITQLQNLPLVNARNKTELTTKLLAKLPKADEMPL